MLCFCFILVLIQCSADMEGIGTVQGQGQGYLNTHLKLSTLKGIATPEASLFKAIGFKWPLLLDNQVISC